MIARLLQLADSAFPNGAFSHSYGLETAIASGAVGDASSLGSWLRSFLDDTLATLDGPALVRAFDEPASAGELDAVIAAATYSDEVRAANHAIAHAMLECYQAMGIDDAALAGYARTVFDETASGVPALALALGAAAAGIGVHDALVGFFSSTIGTLAGAGARGIPLGGRSIARVLWALRDAVEAAALRALALGRSEARLTAQAFGPEIDALQHRLLDGRLFAS